MDHDKEQSHLQQEPQHPDKENQHQQRQDQHRQQQLQVPHRHMYKPPKKKRTLLTWLIGAICTLFWFIIIVGGLAVLTIYLIFRPQSPRFDISSATLNAAYLDTGSLLNADLTILANISNPNKKVDVSFNFFGVDLYYGTTLIATTSVGSFSERRQEAKLGDFHMVSSQVELPLGDIQRLKSELANNTVSFDVKGIFQTWSHLGRNFLHFSYWLHCHCSIVVSSPPGGALLSVKCTTKH